MEKNNGLKKKFSVEIDINTYDKLKKLSVNSKRSVKAMTEICIETAISSIDNTKKDDSEIIKVIRNTVKKNRQRNFIVDNNNHI